MPLSDDQIAALKANIDGLNAAIASGERQVTLGSKSVTYRSIDDLIKARDDMQRQLSAASDTPAPRRFYAYHGGRGY